MPFNFTEVTTLASVALMRGEVMKRKIAIERDHAKNMAEIAEASAELDRRQQLIQQKLNVAQILGGESILSIYGDQAVSGDRPSCVEDAILDIALGAPKLKRCFFGTKDFDRFSDQRTDCDYGYGPRHGSIVFRVGLTRECADRLRNGGALTVAEMESALYILHHVHDYLRARNAKRLALARSE